jgi:hypothetical protein
MLRRSVCVIACWALAAAGAHAQQERYTLPGPEGLPLTVGPLEAEPTQDSVLAQLNEALANYDNSGVRIHDGVVRVGEEIATRAFPYERVTRLANDVSRSGALGGRVVLLPAGAQLYSHDLFNGDMISVHGHARLRRLWCGGSDAAGYCLMQINGDWNIAEIRSDSPYAPIDLGPFVPASEPQFQPEAAEAAGLPPRVEVVSLVGVGGSRARIGRALRVGDQTIEADGLRSSRMRVGSIIVNIEPGPEPDSVTIHSAPMDPADYQTELRRLAYYLVGAVQGSR